MANGLTFPTGVTFDDAGGVYVVESGYVYGEKWTQPRLLKIEAESTRVIASGERNGPWNGVTYAKGAFYVAEGGALEGGRILKIDRNGKITPIVEGLPSLGDHHTNGPVLGSDGYLYFGQGVATNSGVVGEDNASFGWLARHPEVHDVPCHDVTLNGQNFETANPLTPDKKDKASTGAFLPFGTPSTPGQVIQGRVPCSGAIMRVRPEGGAPSLVAWRLPIRPASRSTSRASCTSPTTATMTVAAVRRGGREIYCGRSSAAAGTDGRTTPAAASSSTTTRRGSPSRVRC